jgi:hypothetical protein
MRTVVQIVQMHTTKHCNLQLAYSEDPQAAPYKPPVYSILPYFDLEVQS